MARITNHSNRIAISLEELIILFNTQLPVRLTLPSTIADFCRAAVLTHRETITQTCLMFDGQPVIYRSVTMQRPQAFHSSEQIWKWINPHADIQSDRERLMYRRNKQPLSEETLAQMTADEESGQLEIRDTAETVSEP